MSETNGEYTKLDRLISDLESHGLKTPVLLKQYVRQNAKFMSFNVDPLFSNALDGLMILDLKDVPLETISALEENTKR